MTIDPSDNLYWVFGYAYNNYDGGNYGRNCGDWHLSYGTGAASGDHDFDYTVPITEEYHHRSLAYPGYHYACNDFMFTHSSIGVDSEGGVLIVYQSAHYDRIIYGIRNDGADWADPVEVEGAAFYGMYPYALMHQTDYMMISFTDLDYPSGGTGNPYFVAWK